MNHHLKLTQISKKPKCYGYAVKRSDDNILFRSFVLCCPLMMVCRSNVKMSWRLMAQEELTLLKLQYLNYASIVLSDEFRFWISNIISKSWTVGSLISFDSLVFNNISPTRSKTGSFVILNLWLNMHNKEWKVHNNLYLPTECWRREKNHDYPIVKP